MNPQSAQKWPCGRCKGCRINRKRDWVARMMLEAASSEAAFFITLTYRIVQVSPDGIGTLDPEHTQRWMKRFRKRVDLPVRFFLCGEYGSRTKRPHYHAVLFFPNIDPGTDADIEKIILETWGLGSIHVGDVTEQSLSYTLGYAVKGLTKPQYYPEGVEPEFARYSKGLGKMAMHDLRLDTQLLPSTFRVAGKDFVIPKYLRRKLKNEGYRFDFSGGIDPQPEQVLPMLADLSFAERQEALANIIEAKASYAELRENRRVRSVRKINLGLLDRRKNETI